MMRGVSPDLIVEAFPHWTGPVVHGICNVAAAVDESIAILSLTDNHKADAESQRVVTNLFATVGVVQWLPECQMHATSALGSSSLAFFAQVIKGLAQGAAENIGTGNNNVRRLPLGTALAIAAQAARGTATLLQQSNYPGQLVAQVATMGVTTAAGLAVLKKGKLAQTLQAHFAITAEATAGLTPSIGVGGDSTTGIKMS
jgi:pyrroline-5-carboxylate reductase